MLRFVLLMSLVVTAGLVAAVAWQQWRYLNARRSVVHDRQAIFHSSQVFHVVTWLALREDGEVIDAVRKLRSVLESGGNASMVYAGKAVTNALHSEQLKARLGEEPHWDALVVMQYPSREAFDAIAATDAYRQALLGFAQTWSHGMQRPAMANLMIPVMYLALRVRQIVTGAPSHFPFVQADELPDEAKQRAAELLSEPELGKDAVLVANLLKRGTPAQAAADRAYGMRMLAMMAEAPCGIMHMGRAVSLDPAVEFDQVALVYYPGVQFFADMARSTFFQGIVGDKQLGDTEATVTVPILERL
ncbi:MAG: hypothetical protein QNK05_25305 [Myxococcota bacterium]|nr:hypothetical protein [Myxococcota bacterium]